MSAMLAMREKTAPSPHTNAQWHAAAMVDVREEFVSASMTGLAQLAASSQRAHSTAPLMANACKALAFVTRGTLAPIAPTHCTCAQVAAVGVGSASMASVRAILGTLVMTAPKRSL